MACVRVRSMSIVGSRVVGRVQARVLVAVGARRGAACWVSIAVDRVTLGGRGIGIFIVVS